LYERIDDYNREELLVFSYPSSRKDFRHAIGRDPVASAVDGV
jgi:hypothetical protein